MFETYIGGVAGVQRLRDGELEPLGLEQERIMAIHARRENGATVVLAGSYGNGLFRNAGDGWTRVAEGAFRFLGELDGALLAGTEPARILRSEDGRAWEDMGGIGELPGAGDWFLPYSPRAGAVRNIHAHGGRLFASLEVGGLLASGEPWVCEPVSGDEDVHHVTGDGEVLYVSLGTASLSGGGQHGGIARSFDGGSLWEKVETDYTRATIVPPSRPDLLLAGPAPHVGREGRIVVSADRGDTWEPAGGGIEIPMHDMVELFGAAPDGSIWALCSQGRLLRAEPGEWHWRPTADVEAKSFAFLSD